MKKDN